MYSKAYYDVIENVKKFHLQNKVYSGGGTLAYADDIKQLCEKHHAKSLLDYGCGKGLQYVQGSIISFGNNNESFDKFLGIDSVYKFDPGVDEFEIPPPEGSKFDAVIAIQSLNGVPDIDFPTVVKEIMSMTNKFCFIGISLRKGKTKKGSSDLPDPNFLANRLDPIWWHDQFKNWRGSEIILKFTNQDG